MSRDVAGHPAAADRYAGRNTATSEISLCGTLAALCARAKCQVFGVNKLATREAHVRLNAAKVDHGHLHSVLPAKVSTIMTASAVAHAPAEKATSRSLEFRLESITVSIARKFFPATADWRGWNTVWERNNNALFVVVAVCMVISFRFVVVVLR
jgi:hypothetical protein